VVLCKNTFSGESIAYVIAGMPQAAKGKIIDHNHHSRESENKNVLTLQWILTTRKVTEW
jgi:hypothetical protein